MFVCGHYDDGGFFSVPVKFGRFQPHELPWELPSIYKLRHGEWMHHEKCHLLDMAQHPLYHTIDMNGILHHVQFGGGFPVLVSRNRGNFFAGNWGPKP